MIALGIRCRVGVEEVKEHPRVFARRWDRDMYKFQCFSSTAAQTLHRFPFPPRRIFVVCDSARARGVISLQTSPGAGGTCDAFISREDTTLSPFGCSITA